MKYDFDLFVIGAGSGGVRAARLASTYGAKVAIAEESRVGGTCVIRGCVPKKFFVYASEFGRQIEDAKGYGWHTESKKFDWQVLLQAKDKEIARLSGIYITNLEKAGVEIFHTRAVLKEAHTVHLVGENRDVTAKKILISTGGRPSTDTSIPGHELAITSDEAFHLEHLPKRILVAGGGYIAVEFAFIFAGLGVDTTLIYRGDQILRGFDQDLRDFVTNELHAKGINLVLGKTIKKIEQAGKEKQVTLSDDTTAQFGEVMYAIGRNPHTKGLGLENAGVEAGKDGAILVDEWSRSSVPHIFAVGDVTNRVNLTPVAIREGAAFAETEFNDNPQKMDYMDIPKAVFSQPALSSVGYTEEEAWRDFNDVHIYKSEFRPMKNILAHNTERMLMKLVVDGTTQKVIGCHIAGAEAAEMIQMVAIAVKAGLTKKQFDDTCALHPTAAEELVTMKVRHK